MSVFKRQLLSDIDKRVSEDTELEFVPLLKEGEEEITSEEACRRAEEMSAVFGEQDAEIILARVREQPELQNCRGIALFGTTFRIESTIRATDYPWVEITTIEPWIRILQIRPNDLGDFEIKSVVLDVNDWRQGDLVPRIK